MKIGNHLPIIVILLLALVLRVYSLGHHPPGLTWDEAAIGYNAYSLLETARDEHGTLLPLVFKSFGDFKPGLYIYLTVPFVAIFGLTEFAVRLPSAIIGSLAVYLLFLIIESLTTNKIQYLKIRNSKLGIGHTVALALALQPFHLIYSRGAWETNLVTTIYLAMIYFFLRFLQGGSLMPSALLAASSLFAYQGAKLVLPLLLISQLLIFRHQLLKRLGNSTPSTLAAPIIVGIIFSLIIYLPAVFGGSGGRLAAKSYFSHIPNPDYLARLHQIDPNQLVFNLFHHLRLDQFRSVAYRYFNHLSPRLLFYEGDWQTHFAQIPNMGLLYGIDALLITLGLFYLARRSSNTFNRFWFALLIIAPLPAALTLDEVSSIRAHLLTIPLAILVGAGIYFLFLARGVLWRLLTLAVLSVFLLHFYLAIDGYLVHLPAQSYRTWLYGYRPAIEELSNYPDTPVIISDRLGQPYIFYLFYSRYSPAKYQQQNHLVQNGPDVGYVPTLDNIDFHSFNFLYDQNRANTIYVALPEDLDTSDLPASRGTVLKEILAPDGNLIFRLVKTP